MLSTTCLRASHAPIAAASGCTAVVVGLKRNYVGGRPTSCFWIAVLLCCSRSLSFVDPALGRSIARTRVLRKRVRNIEYRFGMHHVRILPVNSFLPGMLSRAQSPDRWFTTTWYAFSEGAGTHWGRLVLSAFAVRQGEQPQY